MAARMWVTSLMAAEDTTSPARRGPLFPGLRHRRGLLAQRVRRSAVAHVGREGRLPEVDGTILVRGSQAPAVRTEHHAPDTTGMAVEGDQFLAGRAVPDLYLVERRRRHTLAVRAERHGRDKFGM